MNRILPNRSRSALLVCLLAGMCFAVAYGAESAGTEMSSRKSAEDRVAWFREAKYGLFIHWGLYAIPAGQWKGQRVLGIGEWIMNRAQIPVGEYAQLAAQFNPVGFDADAWVRMAKDAGMKYIVITSKHHDGFAMFHSAVSPYNIFDATPFHRDPLKELSVACAKQGIRFGFYYSQAQDWHEPNGAGNTWDFGDEDKKDFDQYLRAKAEPQIKELLTGYGPVCLIWFDTPKMMTKARGDRFAEILRSLQPDCLIDGRLGSAGDYQSTGDNAVPNQVKVGPWETPATINHTWGYRTDDTDWKAPGDILFKLVDIVSKGGNYLLNVGPTAQGTIPPASADNLRAVGEWLKFYGDAIYGSNPTPFGDELGEFSTRTTDLSGKPIFLSRMDWRCTTKPGKLYFTIFKPSRDGLVLPAFKNEIKAAYLLNRGVNEPVTIKDVNGARVADLPKQLPEPMASVLCVEISGEKVER